MCLIGCARDHDCQFWCRFERSENPASTQRQPLIWVLTNFPDPCPTKACQAVHPDMPAKAGHTPKNARMSSRADTPYNTHITLIKIE